MKKLIISAMALVLAVTSCNTAGTKLFNGKDLTGWHQGAGTAEYTVEKGCIVGTCSVENKGN